jgi:hypothetical protein
LEREIGEAVKDVLKAKEPADLIVAALQDFARKVNTVKAGVEHAVLPDGKNPSDEWRNNATSTMNGCLTINNKWRVLLAHASLDIDAEGILKLRQLTIQGGEFKISETTKTAKELQDAAGELDELAKRVRELRTELTTYVFRVETGYFTVRAPDIGSPLLGLTEPSE